MEKMKIIKRWKRDIQRYVCGVVLRAYFKAPDSNFQESYWNRHGDLKLRWKKRKKDVTKRNERAISAEVRRLMSNLTTMVLND